MTAVSRSVVFFAALALLVYNDHVGKRLHPGAVTGKLSDVTGLVVAPLVVWALLGRPKGLVRVAAFVSVVVPFIAVKVSPTASLGVATALGRIGVPSRIWTDPTDLWALLVLPFVWWLCDLGAARQPGVMWTDRVGALLGAAACVATSSEYLPLSSSVFLVNVARTDRNVQIFRLKTALDCPSLPNNPTAGFEASQFGFDRCLVAKPFEANPLDQDAVGKNAPERDGGAAGPLCDAVVVRIEGMQDTAVFWNDVPKIEVNAVDTQGEGQALLIEEYAGRPVIARNAFTKVWTPSWQLPTRSCGGEP